MYKHNTKIGKHLKEKKKVTDKGRKQKEKTQENKDKKGKKEIIYRKWRNVNIQRQRRGIKTNKMSKALYQHCLYK